MKGTYVDCVRINKQCHKEVDHPRLIVRAIRHSKCPNP